MTVVGWFAIWIVIFFFVGIVFTYRIGCLLNSGGQPWAVLFCVAWSGGVGCELDGRCSGYWQGCDETYAAAHRLNGSSWSEFRERCIATSRPADWARR